MSQAAAQNLPKRLLVVEDDPLDFGYIAYCLRRQAEGLVEITWAETIEAAKGRLAESRYDGILLDFHVGSRSPAALVGPILESDMRSVALITSAHRSVFSKFAEALSVDQIIDKTSMSEKVIADYLKSIGVPIH